MAQTDLIQMKIRTGQILQSIDRVILVTKSKKAGEFYFEGTVIQGKRIEHRKDWCITAFKKCGPPHDYEVMIRNGYYR